MSITHHLRPIAALRGRALRAPAALACLLLALSTPLPAGAQAAPGGREVSLNFANAEIGSVIDAIGRISGRNFVIDPRVKGNINIVTHAPVPPELSYDILLSALRLQGFAAVEGRGVTKIVPEADAKLHGMPVRSGAGAGGGDRLITQVFVLRHESAAQMVPVLRPLVSPNNTISAFAANNTLVVTDYAENIARIARIIGSIDVPQGDLMVLELRHAAAADLAPTLNRLLGGGAGGQPADPSQQVAIVPETRSNSLLVRAASAAQLGAVRQLVASLDKPGAAGNLHVVYLRNAEAVQVAATLNAALSGGTGGGGRGSSPMPAPRLQRAAATEAEGALSAVGGDSGGLGIDAGPSFADPGVEPGSGIVQADPASNALIITAPEAVYRGLRYVIDQLDRRRAQVYVEALIAEISSDKAAEIGVQWQSSTQPTQVGERGVFGGTNFGGSGQNIFSPGASTDSGGGTGLNIMVGKLAMEIDGVKFFDLNLLARFLESETRANILSTPNLVTLDNEEAKIVVGRNLPFVTGQYVNTGGGSTPENPFQTIERRDVGLTLRIKPQISEGGAVRLQIYQEASSVVSGVNNPAGPITNKRSIESTVLVDDGSIIALGGLMEDSYSAGEDKVPLLGDIPFAGQLFRYDSRKRTKTNLVVFLRPVILREAGSYDDLTRSRYDYVIGRQRASGQGGNPLMVENAPPLLPPIDGQFQRAPITDAVVMPVAAAGLR
ncbi:type II secretion system secretin GspD [Thauera phenolivorans]|uniref:type II secretion system secretin GspD n=1 Tax=Thauera phenolivorans TaxID=1792543 RepID=UPI0009F61D8A|nr:type II secretion system secretin GspD [Thauera phenolivorans]